jgi:pantoate--beta-alanine ligase
MEVISSAADMRRWSRAHRAAGRRVAFVPTMGFLHEGHLSLVREARARADVVAVSIYVNPAQFAAHEDFGTYPRDDEGDLAKLRAVGADAAFVPAHLYAQDAPTPPPPPPPHETFVTVERLSTGLCSTTRPHFFRGVATVVCKLFNVVEPDVAVFGKKDYQQFRVVQRMVRDLDYDIRIVGVELTREPDGLAMSSRNVRLDPEARVAARAISKALAGLKRDFDREGEEGGGGGGGGGGGARGSIPNRSRRPGGDQAARRRRRRGVGGRGGLRRGGRSAHPPPGGETGQGGIERGRAGGGEVRGGQAPG